MLKFAKSLSVKTYAIIFIALLALLFGIFTAFTLNKINWVRIQVDAQHAQSAKLEVVQAVLLLNQKMMQDTQKFIDSNETYQQFFDASYYDYWRTSVFQRGILPESVIGFELYDRTGKPIANPTQPPLSKNLLGKSRLTVSRQGRQINGFLLRPIYDGYSRISPSGYALIQFDFIQALVSTMPFHFIDVHRISITLKDGQTVDLDSLVDHIHYQLSSNPEVNHLFTMMYRDRYQMAAILFLLSVILYYGLMRFVAYPLQRLSQHINALKNNYDPSRRPELQLELPILELEHVRHSLNDYQRQLDSMHQRIEEKNAELWGMAHCDALTGAYNRRSFDEDIKTLLLNAVHQELEVALLLFDCDYFKSINDTYGHQVGDQVLIAIAKVMQACLRGSDKLYRIGGDEFAVLFVDEDSTRSIEVAHRCIAGMQHYDFSYLKIKDPVRISVGIARMHHISVDQVEMLKKQADIAMYHAKLPGHNKVVIYDAAMEVFGKSVFSNQLTNAVFNAIQTGEGILIHYQPVISLTTREVEYYEALVRLKIDNELILPDEIFPVVTARRLEAEFDYAIMKCVANDLEKQLIPLGTGVALNISGVSLEHAEFQSRIAHFQAFLEKYKLVLELTETSLITRLQQVSSTLMGLREVGFVVALDDFGSGYSSLSYIANMPVDIVKFDLSMIRSLEQGGRQSVVIEGLARIIAEAGYLLVAEGIETEQALNKVQQLGFSHGQGYLFGPASEFTISC